MMEQLAAHDVDSARRASAVPRIVFLTLGGALLLGVGLIAALMVFNAQVLDSRAQHASVDAMREGLDERARQLDRVVGTNAWRNEAVEAIQSRQDRAWAAVNLGSDIYHTYSYDWAFVIAPDGSTFHAALEGNPVADDISTALGNDLWRPLVEQSRGVVVDGGLRAVHAYTSMRDGRLGIISAAAIMPEDGPTRTRPAGAPYVLVLVRGLTLEWLAELAGALNLSELSFNPSLQLPTSGLLLTGPDGMPIGSVSWQARQPGMEFFAAIAPSFGVALALLLGFMWSAWQLHRAACDKRC